MSKVVKLEFVKRSLPRDCAPAGEQQMDGSEVVMLPGTDFSAVMRALRNVKTLGHGHRRRQKAPRETTAIPDEM
jgi:hypothetical protein